MSRYVRKDAGFQSDTVVLRGTIGRVPQQGYLDTRNEKVTDSSVNAVKRLRHGRSRNRGSIPGRYKMFGGSHPASQLMRIGGSNTKHIVYISIYIYVYTLYALYYCPNTTGMTHLKNCGLFPEVKQPEREAEQSPHPGPLPHMPSWCVQGNSASFYIKK
jgi:hypothetical protein